MGRKKKTESKQPLMEVPFMEIPKKKNGPERLERKQNFEHPKFDKFKKGLINHDQ